MFEDGEALDASVSISHLAEGVIKSEPRVLETSGFERFDVVGCQESTGDVLKVVGGHRGRGWFFQSGFLFIRRLVV